MVVLGLESSYDCKLICCALSWLPRREKASCQYCITHWGPEPLPWATQERERDTETETKGGREGELLLHYWDPCGVLGSWVGAQAQSQPLLLGQPWALIFLLPPREPAWSSTWSRGAKVGNLEIYFHLVYNCVVCHGSGSKGWTTCLYSVAWGQLFAFHLCRQCMGLGGMLAPKGLVKET